MFRAEIRWLTAGPTLKMKGEIHRRWAEQARALITKDAIPAGLIVDLSEVSYVDSAGERLLKWLADIGAIFVAGDVYTLNICDRLHLSLLQSSRNAPVSGQIRLEGRSTHLGGTHDR